MLSVIAQTWRSWKNAKTIALLSMIALAVGTGSTTAIYTVVNAVMLKPLIYEHGDRFVALYGRTLTDSQSYSSSTFRDLQIYQQRTRSFDVFGWFRVLNFNLTSPGQPQHITGAAVTPALAHNLGVAPSLGRWFDDDTGAVISAALWNRLGADSSIVGKAIVLNGRSYTVTGVMPSQFQLPIVSTDFERGENDVWIGLDAAGRGLNPNEFAYFCYARLKPGVTHAEAEQDVKRVAAEIAQEEPASHPSYTARLDSLRETVVSGIRPTLMLLFAASGLLLLITAANVGGLMLARSVARARETAIRVSLGATARRIGGQYFIEALFVSAAGAAAGVFLSVEIVRLVTSIAGGYIPDADRIAIDWTVLLFCFRSCISRGDALRTGSALAGGSYSTERSTQRRRALVGGLEEPQAVARSGRCRDRAGICAVVRQWCFDREPGKPESHLAGVRYEQPRHLPAYRRGQRHFRGSEARPVSECADSRAGSHSRRGRSGVRESTAARWVLHERIYLS